MGSKDAEHQCLNRVINEIKFQHGRSKTILDMFTNTEVSRTIDECPDFIKYCPPKSKNSKPILLGIEHFQVDHFSIRQESGKIGATVNKYQIEDENRRNIFEAERKQPGELTDRAISAFAMSVGQSLQKWYNAEYAMYIESFRYSLEKHLSRVDTYLHNINSLSKGRFSVKLAFLIEIYSDFRRSYLTAHGSTKLADTTFIPIFEDVVHMLENIDDKKVQYIVLCLNTPIPGERTKVVALNTVNLRKQIERQHLLIYNYAGELCNQRFAEISPAFTREGDIINFEMTAAIRQTDMDSQMQLIIPAFLDALTFEVDKKPYLTTPTVQLMMELFGDYYIRYGNFRSNNAKDLWRYIMMIDGDKIQKRWEKLQKLQFQGGMEKENGENPGIA